MMETGKTNSKKSRKGMVLPLVITIAVALAILGIGLMQLGYGSRLMAALTTSAITARAAADGGLTDALYKMNRALNFDGSINPALWPADALNVPLPDADYPNAHFSYEITGPYDPPPGQPYQYWEIESTGRSGREIRKVFARTRRQSYWFGVGVQDTFTVHDNAIFGTFPPGSTFDGSVRTNSIANDAITIQTENHIPGDVAMGPGGEETVVVKTPGEDPDEIVDGSIYASADTLAFPDAQLPPANELPPGGGQLILVEADYVNTGEIDLATGLPIMRATRTSGPAGVMYVNQDLTLRAFRGGALWELRLIGSFLINVTHDMIIQGNARLTIGDGDGAFIDTLELYLGSSGPVVPANRSSLDAKAGSSIVTMPRAIGELPHTVDLRIYGLPTCYSAGDSPSITIHNSGEFWGVIYAPDARLNIQNSGIMYGGFVGYSIDLYGSGGFYYDTRIPLEYYEGPSFFEIDRWWEQVVPAE